MKSQLRKRLHRLFMENLVSRLPGFSLLQGAKLPAGDLAFVATPYPGLSLFVVLEVNHDSDAFNVALAWSVGDGELPRFGAMEPTDPPVGGKHRFSLSRLWETGTSRDPWYWRLAPLPTLADTDAWLAADLPFSELQQRLESLATDALDRQADHAASYFATVMERHRPGEN